MKLPWMSIHAACCFLLLALVVSGCATKRIDWSARVGNYSYDQAITEFGPPEKSAKLTDGTVVADWLLYRGYSTYTGWRGDYGWAYVSPPTPDSLLRLTFGADGKLRAWKKVYR